MLGDPDLLSAAPQVCREHPPRRLGYAATHVAEGVPVPQQPSPHTGNISQTVVRAAWKRSRRRIGQSTVLASASWQYHALVRVEWRRIASAGGLLEPGLNASAGVAVASPDAMRG